MRLTTSQTTAYDEPEAGGAAETGDAVETGDASETGNASEPSDFPVLTVRVVRAVPGGEGVIGWATADGKTVGLLNPVYEEGPSVRRGPVPAAPLSLYADGLENSAGSEGRGSVDMSDGLATEVRVALDQPRNLVTRRVVVRDGKGKPISAVFGEPVLDGSPNAVLNALLNYQQWVSDENGFLNVRSIASETVQLALSLPLLDPPVQATLKPNAKELVLEDVTIVRCHFRCPANGKAAPYPGFVAIAELHDGTQRRYEMPESDGLHSGPAVITWPKNTKKLSVYSSPYKEASITSPTQRCELQSLRQCENW